MQTLHFPFFFLTTTTPASHSGYCTSRMNPVPSRLFTSSLMIASLSGANFLLFCLMGWCRGSTCSLKSEKITYKLWFLLDLIAVVARSRRRSISSPSSLDLVAIIARSCLLRERGYTRSHHRLSISSPSSLDFVAVAIFARSHRRRSVEAFSRERKR